MNDDYPSPIFQREWILHVRTGICLLAVILVFLLAACGNDAPTTTLGVAGQPTLVFVYTEA